MLLISHKKTTKNERGAARNLSPTTLSHTKKTEKTKYHTFTRLYNTKIFVAERIEHMIVSPPNHVAKIMVNLLGACHGGGGRAVTEIRIICMLHLVCRLFCIFFFFFLHLLLLTECVLLIDRHARSISLSLSFSQSLFCFALLTHYGAL